MTAFFASPEELRAWFAENAGTASELVVGFWKKSSGKPSITWREAVDEALCVGWIDGRGGRLDEHSHAVRFTPRRPGSTWSLVNLARMEALEAEGRVTDAGRAALAGRREDRTGTYSHEQGDVGLGDYEARLQAEPAAWEWFSTQAPSYRRGASWWVVSAKQEATRERRFAALLADSLAGKRLKHLSR